MKEMREKGEHTGKIISRREFLKLAATGGALAFLSELGFSQKALAELEKFLKERPFIEKNFDDGIALLKREMETNPLERMWVYVEKGGHHGWIDVAEAATEEQVTSIDLGELQEDTGISKLQFIHTHPLPVYQKLLSPNALASERSKRGEFPIPPSSNDIFVVFKYRELAERKRLPYPVLHSVMEPSGVWDIDIDKNHDFVWEVGRYLAEDEDPIALSLEFSKQYREKCNNILWGWSDSKPIKEFDAAEATKEFQEWVRKEYGVILKHKKHSI